PAGEGCRPRWADSYSFVVRLPSLTSRVSRPPTRRARSHGLRSPYRSRMQIFFGYHSHAKAKPIGQPCSHPARRHRPAVRRRDPGPAPRGLAVRPLRVVHLTRGYHLTPTVCGLPDGQLAGALPPRRGVRLTRAAVRAL